MTTLGPSAVAFQEGTVPEELTHDQIKEIIQAFADAAVRAKKAVGDDFTVAICFGACDLVGVGRAILKDADWAAKALEA